MRRVFLAATLVGLACATAAGVGTVVSYAQRGGTVETWQAAADRQAVAGARARVAATDPGTFIDANWEPRDWLEQLARWCRDAPHRQDGISDKRDWRQAEAW
jgi:hypothetical protein